MNKIKIVFLLGTLGIGGTEKQLLEILRRINRDRFELRVLSLPCFGKLRDEIESLNIPFSCLNTVSLAKGRFHPGSYVQLYQLLRDVVRYLKHEKPHIVQSYLFWTNIYGSIAAKIAGVPVIITGRRETLEKKYLRFPNLWLQNFSNLWATTIIANSLIVKQECLQQEKFVTSEKIQVIHNGLDVDRYNIQIDPQNQKKALQIPDNGHIVGIVARLHPRKGHRVFLKAAVQVLQAYPQTIFLVIGGDQGIQPELERFAQELGIRNSVVFTGERRDIPELLSILDVQVSTSFIEGLSNAILEGMASGKPIVATDVAGNPELVIHGQTGLLIPPGNPARLAEAIIQLLGNRSLCIQFGNAGKQRVNTLFRMDQTIFQSEALYQKLIHEGKLS